MKIVICGSLTATDEILEVRDKLVNQGHQVEVPTGSKTEEIKQRVKNRQKIVHSEEASEKEKFDVIRDYYEKIKQHDIVLIVNPQKKGVKGYIGGNTLIEMGFAHVLGKKIYCLYSIPDMSYTAEILAMKPTVLSGDLRNI